MDINSLLQPFGRFGVNLGLSRILKLLANLGNPHHQVPVIHVAGTNGKGSVCAYLSSILTEAGYRTGCYISPHLVDWTERISINKEPISSDKFSQLILQVKDAIQPDHEYPTQFEVITAAAWLYFAQAKVDVAVVEVGLGGRLDATNVSDQPLVTIITSISREHWQQLGPTVADIAREKAGIIKPGCPVVVGQLPPEAEKVVRSRAQELQSSYIAPPPAHQITPRWAEYKTIKNSHIIKYPLPLHGQIQLTNSALALAAVEILNNTGWEICQESIVNGMSKTQWPGRMQWVSWNQQKLLIDGAHNPGAAHALRDYIDSLDIPKITWIMGMLATKEHHDIFRALLRSPPAGGASSPKAGGASSHDQLYLVPVPDHSSANPLELAKIAREICPELSICETHPDLSSALEAAFTSTNNQVVLCGSLYLIGHFFTISHSVN
ncbi:bifunctional folylpolyglutamate synthase/dihydrofolate synthase [Nodularia sphaerocarpa]|uniref:bifunctional folylpolyglutamate synthase/dihydrofolate synthase n=1 Tax=Nodularia sphaerocarpa TaxID=137816 RepID=UPI001EFA77B3|nr:folylpolyglutamate synthase/dihydrofolate synthase family protein [Nodularia sphaerocarpa]MDB9375568.1 bifunctional folylpolyglutamate synthase/dihydrofolate synthase [Nodularia sphaerocarpa CS-585]MDB9378775.1 bifunctional folylpolyglutamate synthase/dihydrofolate synthase [Nodularia sphaerocarpa CS-585A2]ULP73881.1 Folylpolyglutamate synthase [Nodularia sphaerocarpa UHCC 0038]